VSTDDRLARLLLDPDLAWLLERLRRRIESGEELRGTVSLRAPTPAQREAVGRLFGTAGGHGASIAVDLGRLEALLVEAGLCDSLRQAIESLLGPIENRRAASELEAERWESLFARLEAEAAGRLAELAWIEELRSSGLLKRLGGGDPDRAMKLGLECLEIGRRLPAPHVAIAELAASIAGDAHALDSGEPLGTLALHLVARRLGTEAPEGAEARREAWAEVGVLCDELSAPVLVLNLRAAGSTLTARSLELHAEAAEPCRLSLRQLQREPLCFGADRPREVFVCENPSVVVAAANALGARCAPLVCTEGMPRTSARTLLGQLSSAGIALRYHGDFDWAGLRIANLVIERCGASPWRMAARDYEQAAGGGIELTGDPVAARWDADLEPAMRRVGRAVHEERVIQVLLDDLARAR
jgi:uncharacterized protein (TIGR02679 family)